MDLVDKKILFNVLKDGRISQRQIAINVGISAQALSYRMSKLLSDGVIRRFVLHVSPLLEGKVEGFAAFKSDKEYGGDVFSVVKCLEEITLYGFRGNEYGDVEKQIAEAEKHLGKTVMKYIPPAGNLGMNLNMNDLRIIELLRGDPRMSITDLATKLDLPYMTAKRRLNLMMKNRLIGIIAELDLTGGDVVIFSIFSRKVNEVTPILVPSAIFAIRDSEAGVFMCYSETLFAARENISRVRKVDPDADVMILYEYRFFS